VLARSKDGGKTFAAAPAPNHIVARPPFAVAEDASGPPQGFFTTSNIVKRDRYYYTFVYTFGFSGQAAGNCLLRTDDLNEVASWRAWNGEEFSVSLSGRSEARSSRQTWRPCVTVPGLRHPVRALLWHEATRQFVGIFSEATRVQNESGTRVRVDFRYSLSPDLLNWSRAQTFRSESSPPCRGAGVPSVSYPSIIDPESPDLSFGTLGTGGYLYFTRYNDASRCKMTMDRDLVRVAVQVGVTAGPAVNAR
jgi:hypothetical protein